MKKLTILAITVLVLAMVLALAAYTAKPVPKLLDRVDIGNTTSEATHDVNVSVTDDWGPVEPATNGGNWGGFGTSGEDCRVVWHAASDPTPMYATLTLDTGGAFARRIVLRVLDGIADDSFNVYVKNPGGDWALVYSYDCDPSTSEFWVEHEIFSFPAGKGQGTTIEIKIEAIGAAWSGFNTYGQLAVDWIEVWGY